MEGERSAAWVLAASLSLPQQRYNSSGDPLVALDLAAMHDAPRLRVERIAPVQYGKIVPHQHVAHLPFVAHGEARLRRVRPECVEQRFALRHFETDYVGIRAAAEKQRLTSSLRLSAHQGMMCADRQPDVSDFLGALAQHARAVGRRIVHRDLASNRLLQIRRQGFIRRKHVCEIGVAARLRWRHFERVQHRSLGRYVHIGHVSMPHRLTVAEISDRLAVFDDVRDDIQLWVVFVERLAVRIRPRWIELSKVPTEGDELWVRELLAMENDDEPLTPYVFDRFDVAERDGLRKIDAGDFGAQRGVQVPD